jgi:rare lipoprotein A
MKKRNIICCIVSLVLCVANLVAATPPEFGSASYYSNKFEGRPTTSGELYNTKLFTAAHKTLPLGTVVRVTRIDNSKSVVVRINDRIPAKKEGTVIDLSYAAAEAIDLVTAGRSQVKVEVVDATTKPVSAVSALKSTTTAAAANATKATSTTPAVKSAKAAAGKVITPANPVQASTPTTATTAAPTKVTLAPKGITAASPTTAATSESIPNLTDTPIMAQTPITKTKPAKPAKVNAGTWQINVKKAPEKGFAVQLLVLTNADLILAESAKIEAKFPGKVLVKEGPDDAGNPMYKLMLGAYPDRKSAEAAQKNATKKGFSKCFVVELK